MPRPSKTEQELGYLKDFWNEVRQTESEYHGTFEMLVTPTARPGVMQYRMVFTPLFNGQRNGIGVVALTFAYPNVEQSSYAGFMWRKAITLSRMVVEEAEKYGRAP